MSHLGKINWRRLGNAAKETFLSMVAFVVFAALSGAPLVLALVTNNISWLLLYAVAFFILQTLENYNERY